MSGKYLIRCSLSTHHLPRNVAMVGKKRAPQKFLVMEIGSVEGGIEAAAPLPSRSGSPEKAGRR